MSSPVAMAARGKWQSIIGELTSIDAKKYLDGKHHTCPVTGEGENRFRFSDRNGTGSFFCACSDGKGDGFDLLKCCNNWDFKEAALEVEKIVGALPVKMKQEKSEEIVFRDLRSIKRSISNSSDIVLSYLRSRGMSEIDVLPRVLRQGFINYAIKEFSKTSLPAMVAMVHSPKGKVVTFHLTYLKPDGSDRVRHDRAKVVATPVEDMRGSAVRLAAVGEDGRLGVGEGIESSLSAGLLFGIPTWATLNANNMENFVWPEGLQELVIFADHDHLTFTGQAAAYRLAHRAAVSRNKVPKVVVHLPPPGMDWNDVLQRQRAEERGEIVDGN